MAKDILHCFDSFAFTDGKVDAVNGVIRDVSVITEGVTARGHNLEVDEKTLEQMHHCAAKMGKVSVKTDHKSGSANINGYLTNFQVKGGKLKADWHLLKSHPQYGHILEMAERMPSNFGLSAAFMGKEEAKGVKKFARCTELVSVDLVTQPAANPDGLFESKVDTQKITNLMATENEKTPDQKYEELLSMFAASQAQMEQFGSVLNQLVEFAMSEDDESESDEGEDESEEDEKEHKGKHEYSSAEQALNYLEAKMTRQLEAEKDAEMTHAFDVIQEKVIALSEINEALKAENDALRLNFERGNGTVASASRASDVHLFSQGDANKDEWEAYVTELEAGGKTKVQAIQFSIAERPDLYLKHQQRIGLVRL